MTRHLKKLCLLDAIYFIYIYIYISYWFFIKEVQYYIFGSGILNITFVCILMFTFSVVVLYHIVIVTREQAHFICYIDVVLNFIKKMTHVIIRTHNQCYKADITEKTSTPHFLMLATLNIMSLS